MQKNAKMQKITYDVRSSAGCLILFFAFSLWIKVKYTARNRKRPPYYIFVCEVCLKHLVFWGRLFQTLGTLVRMSF